MRVFVTGATGFVGSAVVQDLIAAGHRVSASPAPMPAPRRWPRWARGPSRVAGRSRVPAQRRGRDRRRPHLGFNHDFSKFPDNCELDRRAIQALGEVLKGSEPPLIVTSASRCLRRDASPPRTMAHRTAFHAVGIDRAVAGRRPRRRGPPPAVHGDGDHGFVPILITLARQKGVSAYVGEGSNRWPAVHRFDAARVYRLALEQGATASPITRSPRKACRSRRLPR